ncbi:hypothetical protein AcV7_001596 [Taiwanofungus camphoratus]|nr:hypothetical protein AcV7_001596 [Antrodia cinnamomea]
MKGITTLQKVTGKEHADICCVLLGLIIGLPLRAGQSAVRLIRAVRALLDFLYLAQYPAHTSETSKLLTDSLARFHANKSIFVDLGIRLHFRLPKLHALDHYLASIQLFGTTDNYDTQYSERLHIDLVKNAYRATNQKDEFTQMTVWLEIKEKVGCHEAYIQWRIRSQVSNPLPPKALVDSGKPPIHMSRNPSVKAVPFSLIISDYGATYFRDALARFVIRHRDPSLTTMQVERASASIYFAFRTVPVYHKIKLWIDNAQAFNISGQMMDVVHARPQRKDKQKRDVPGRFDTVLVNEGGGSSIGVAGYRVGQV